jgi:hypothetical protein
VQPLFSLVANETYAFTAVERSIHMVDLATRRIVRDYPASFRLNSLALSADGTQLAGTAGNGLTLWRVDTPSELRTWVENNRYLRGLTCEEEVIYRLHADNCPTAP